MKGHQFKALVILALTLLATGGANSLRPTQPIADSIALIDLEAMVPQEFADWKVDQEGSIQIVDPRQRQKIEQTYARTLSRTYVSGRGYRVMLAIAYARSQKDAVQVHKPEVCYPAQGFTLHERNSTVLSTEFGDVPVTRIVTSQGARTEPVTYWITVGDRAISGGVHKKVVEIGYGIRGEVPDGMLVRLSSIDHDSTHAYEIHAEFANDLLAAVVPAARMRLAGVN